MSDGLALAITAVDICHRHGGFRLTPVIFFASSLSPYLCLVMGMAILERFVQKIPSLIYLAPDGNTELKYSSTVRDLARISQHPAALLPF